MNLRCSLLLACPLILLFGCDRKVNETTGQPPKTAGDEVTSSLKPILVEQKITKVQMERTGCYGFCPVYEVDIDNNGTVNFNGITHIAMPGPHTRAAAQPDVDALISEIKRINFFKLKDSYRFMRDGCTSWATDGPSVSIAVTQGDEIKHVVYYYGCTGFAAEQDLKSLAKSIDRVAKTKKWIGGRDKVL